MKNPPAVAFTIFGMDIMFYGLLMSLSILAAASFAFINAPRRNVKRDDIIDLVLVALPLGIIGARLLYVLTFLGEFHSFYDVINIRAGGLSIFGALIFGAAGVFTVCKVKKVSFIKVADVVAPGLALAQSIGRWGNFFNQELYGPKVNFNAFPFSVYIDHTESYHAATFFYESVWNLINFTVAYQILKRTKKPGLAVSFYFMFYGIGRFIIEIFRQDSTYVFGNGGLKFLQIFAILFIITGILGLIYFSRKKDKIEG